MATLLLAGAAQNVSTGKIANHAFSGVGQTVQVWCPIVYNPPKSKTVVLLNKLGPLRSIQVQALIECDH